MKYRKSPSVIMVDIRWIRVNWFVCYWWWICL